MDPQRRLVNRAGLAGALAWSARARGAWRPGPLVIWFTVEGSKALRRIGQRFTADTGVEVIVEAPDPLDGPSRFQQLSAAGKGPDLYIYAHDRLGEWVESGLLHAVNPSRPIVDDIEPLAWRGFTYGGRIWGYPYAIEAVTLLYNKALVATPPRSFEAVFALDAELARQRRHALLWDYTNAYFTWPLLAAGGGYAFRERPDGSYDAHDTGVADAGAVAGAELLARMIRGGLMPAGSGYPEMEAGIAQGRIASIISGPWSWLNLRRAGIDFGAARIPAVDGHAARPFVGIKGVLVNRASRQVELATEFVEHYMLALPGLREIDRTEAIGAPASRAYYAERAGDPGIAAIMASARDGVPTPSNPEMGRFWSSMKTALLNLTEGRQTPRAALEAAARRIVAS